jgi:hypothetical protein
MSNGIAPPEEPPPEESPPEAPVQLAALPAARPTDHYIFSATDAAILLDHSAGGTIGLGECLTMNPSDVASVFGPVSASAGVSITSLSPNTIAHGGPPFALTVNGTGFQAGAIIHFNGSQATTFVSSTQLTCTVNRGGMKAGQSVGAYVTNPDGTRSATSIFSVT